MKQYFLKAAGMALLAVTLQAKGFSQDEAPKIKPDQPHMQEEIIIKKKGDKDSKITVEMKDGEVFINGKKLDEFSDDNISVQKRTMHIQLDGVGSDDFDMAMAPGTRLSPFRSGTLTFTGDGYDNNIAAKRAFLGVTSEKKEDGVKIIEVTKASAAEKSGLLKGDIITKVDELSITTPEELSKAIHKYKPEDKITVTYKRNGKEQKVNVVLGKFKGMVQSYNQSYNFEMPKLEQFYDNMSKLNAPRAMGMGWSNGRPKIGLKAQDTEDGKGVKVLDVDEESPADKAGIKEGDIITEFDGKAVNSTDELANLSRGAREKASFKVKFKRDDQSQEVEVKIPKKLKTADL